MSRKNRERNREVEPVKEPTVEANNEPIKETPVIIVYAFEPVQVTAVFIDGRPYPFEQKPAEKGVYELRYQLVEPEAWPDGVKVELFGKRFKTSTADAPLAVNTDLRPRAWLCWDADPTDHIFG